MKKIEINDLFDFKFVSAPSFSPNGKYAAFIVQTASKDENRYLGDIWILDVALKTTRKLTSGGDAKGYVWTKEGTLLFSAVRDKKLKDKLQSGEEISCWYEISPEGGEAQLAFTLPLKVKELSPVDEDHYVVKAAFDNNRPDLDALDAIERKKTLETLTNPSCVVLEEAPFWTNGGSFTSGIRSRLYIYTRSTEELKPVTDPWFETVGYSVCGTKLLYKGVEWREVKIDREFPGFWIYDIVSGEKRCVLETGTIRTGNCALLENGSALIAATDEIPYGRYQYMDFYKLDTVTCKLQKITDYEASFGRNSVNSDACLGGGGRKVKASGGKCYFITTIDSGSYLRYIDENGVVSDNLTPDGACISFDIYEDYMLFCGMYENKPAELYLNGEQVTFFNDAWVSEHDIVTPEYHSFTDSDGYEVHGWALKPVGYEKGKKYPAILHIHGGPRTVFGTVLHHEMQMWASSGYFVFYCNPRGSDGRGSDFGNIKGMLGTVDYQDIMEFADEMLKKYPDADEKNFGVAGGSYGGFMTNWIIGHTDRFKAAVSQRSISNWITEEHTSDIGIWYSPDNLGVTTRENVEKLWWHSPLKYADKCTTPTLFIHSDKDYRCWLVEGISMFTAIKISGCESRMCIFKGENHELSRSGKPQNRIRRMEEIIAWFDKYCKAD